MRSLIAAVDNFKLTPKEKRKVFYCFLAVPLAFVLEPSPIIPLLFFPVVAAMLYFGRRRDRS